MSIAIKIADPAQVALIRENRMHRMYQVHSSLSGGCHYRRQQTHAHRLVRGVYWLWVMRTTMPGGLH